MTEPEKHLLTTSPMNGSEAGIFTNTEVLPVNPVFPSTL